MIKTTLVATAIVINIPAAGTPIERPPPVENPEVVVADQAKQCWNLLPHLARANFEIGLSANFDEDGRVSDAEIVSVEPANSDTEQAAQLALSALEGCGPYPIYLDVPTELQIVLAP